MTTAIRVEGARALREMYRGQFAPEFEYEEWAISWRARVHGAYLDFARASTQQFADLGELKAGIDVCLRVLSVDPHADDIERSLVWLYWRSGARSAAETQYAHYASEERRDGLMATSFSEIVSQEGTTA
jgi:two-component SAPR family response regulator